MKCPRCKLVWKVKAYSDGGKIRWSKLTKEQRLEWAAKMQAGRRAQRLQVREAKLKAQSTTQQP
jgi:hypothetical protein